MNLCKISNPLNYLEKYQNQLYLSNNIGKYEDKFNDELHQKIKNLKTIKFNININESFILRDKYDNKIFFLYNLFDCNLLYFDFNLTIFDVKILLNNYLIVITKNNNYYINIKDLTWTKDEKEIIFDDIYKKIKKIIKNNMFNKTFNIKEKMPDINLDENKIQEKDLQNIQIKISDININFNKLWNIFSICDNESNYCLSKHINNKEYIFYIINFTETPLVLSLSNLIKYLDEIFFVPFKECCFFLSE